MTDAMLLCAGFGTRLLPLSEQCPKPLMPVGDRPLLCHLLDLATAEGLRVAVINAHHVADRVVEFVDRYDSTIHVSLELELLGTAGGIARAAPWLRSDVAVIWNGDILAQPDPAALIDAAEGMGAALLVAPRARGEGTVGMDREGRIVRLRGEIFGSEAWGGDYLGLCALCREARSSLPTRGCLVGDWCLPRLRRGGVIQAVPHRGPWRDIGTLESYQAANLEWLRGNLHLLDSQNSYRGAGSWTAERVSVHGTVLGEGARIDGSGLVERCVLWPGAHATAPLSDCVVTTDGSVVPVSTAGLRR